MSSSPEQGLLDLSVELSTSDVIAGKQFTLFLVIKNPFTKPVWIRDVDVMLPSDLIKVIDKKHLEDINKQIEEFNKNKIIDNDNPENSNQIVVDGDALVYKITIASNRRLLLKVDGNAKVEEIEYFEPSYIDIAKTGALQLKTSLPSNKPLQSGSTIIATAQLNVNNSIFFVPAKYRLQFTVNYSFENGTLVKNEKRIANSPTDRKTEEFDGDVYSNTVSHPISIRPSVMSMIVGSIIGGLVGSITRILKVTSSLNNLSLDIFIGVAVAVLLSAIAVVFVARKSDNQSFITVEDFWGGLLIGFLVGYTGTSFFETMTGFNESGRIGK